MRGLHASLGSHVDWAYICMDGSSTMLFILSLAHWSTCLPYERFAGEFKVYAVSLRTYCLVPPMITLLRDSKVRVDICLLLFHSSSLKP